MASIDVLVHRDLSTLWQGRNLGKLGENIAVGPPSFSASELHEAWMNSPEHRDNILNPAYDQLAIGVYCSGGKLWATQEFGTSGIGLLAAPTTPATDIHSAPGDSSLSCSSAH